MSNYYIQKLYTLGFSEGCTGLGTASILHPDLVAPTSRECEANWQIKIMMLPTMNRYGALLMTSLLLLLTGCSNKQSSTSNEAQASTLTQTSHTGTWVVNLDSDYLSIYLPPDGDKAYVMEGTPNSQNEVYEIPITRVSEDWELPEGTKVISLIEAAESGAVAAQQSEARTYVGSMNRAQQAFFLEQAEFSSDFDALGLGISSQTDDYSYSIASRTQSHVVNIAQSKKAELKNYVGVTYLTKTEQGEKTTRVIFCESQDSGQDITELSRGFFDPKNAACPSGFMDVR